MKPDLSYEKLSYFKNLLLYMIRKSTVQYKMGIPVQNHCIQPVRKS